MITDDAWQKHDITTLTPEILLYSVVEPKVAVPFRYYLEREKYNIDIEVNSGKEVSGIALQILATDKINGDVLIIKSQWNGNCGIIDNVSKNGKLEHPRDATHKLYFFTLQTLESLVLCGEVTLLYAKMGNLKRLNITHNFQLY